LQSVWTWVVVILWFTCAFHPDSARRGGLVKALSGKLFVYPVGEAL
jgi:hypothetical protein